MEIFQSWASKGATFGLAQLYDPALPPARAPDYPPVGVYLYGVVGYLQEFANGIAPSSIVSHALLKLPAIVADLLLALLILHVLGRLTSKRLALVGAAGFLFHPAVWHDSAVWGQTDSVYTLMVLAAIVAAADHRWMIAGALATLAALTKIQAVIFLPLFVPLLIADRRRVFRFGAAAAAVVGIVFLPLVLAGDADEAVAVYTKAVGAYPILSSNAFNLWWAIFSADAGETLDTVRFLGVSYKLWGLALFSACLGSVLWQLRGLRESVTDREVTLVKLMSAAAVVALCFFLFPTEMHERYMYPFVVFALPWALASRYAFAAYLTLTGLLFFNMLRPVPLDLRSYILFLRYPWVTVIAAVAIVVVGIPTIVMMLRSISRARRPLISSPSAP